MYNMMSFIGYIKNAVIKLTISINLTMTFVICGILVTKLVTLTQADY